MRQPLAGLIRFFAVPERVQHNFTFEDVVAEAIFPPADAPLTFARLQSRKLFDMMPATAVLRIFAEDCDQFFEDRDEFDFPARSFSEFAFKRRGADHAERSRHARGYLINTFKALSH
jgi:hypothetical protein